MIRVISRTKCLLLVALAVLVGVGAKPTFEYIATKVMDPVVPIVDATQRRVAVHEAGHAVAAYALHPITPPTELKVFIERHKSTGGLGYTVTGGPEGIPTSGRVFDMVTELMASMAAEAIVTGDVSIAHSDDLGRANRMLAQVCGQAGMCGTLIVETGGPRLEAMVQSHLMKSYHRASALIRTNKDVVKALADLVMAQPVVKGQRTLSSRQLADFFQGHKVDEVAPETRQIAPIVNEK